MDKWREYLAVWRSRNKSLYGIKSRTLSSAFIVSFNSVYKRNDRFIDLNGNELVVLTGNKILIWLWKKLFR